jgi:hypothetical protein
MGLRAIVNVSASGDNVIVAAASVPPGMCLRVLAWQLTGAGAVAAFWKSSGGTTLWGPLQIGAAGGGENSPSVMPGERGQFLTRKGEGLTLNLSGAVNVTGGVVYEWAAQ